MWRMLNAAWCVDQMTCLRTSSSGYRITEFFWSVHVEQVLLDESQVNHRIARGGAGKHTKAFIYLDPHMGLKVTTSCKTRCRWRCQSGGDVKQANARVHGELMYLEPRTLRKPYRTAETPAANIVFISPPPLLCGERVCRRSYMTAHVCFSSMLIELEVLYLSQTWEITYIMLHQQVWSASIWLLQIWPDRSCVIQNYCWLHIWMFESMDIRVTVSQENPN